MVRRRVRVHDSALAKVASTIALGSFVLAGSLVHGCSRNPGGDLVPPTNSPAWEQRFAAAFDDAYTRESISLEGRASHDVLDQRLFSARLGHAALIATVRVNQVFGRGRYQGRQEQFLDVTIEDVLMGELPPKTSADHLLVVRTEDELPGALQGQQMIMFLRWAPDESPPYHHHLMPADDRTTNWIRSMVEHAQREGVLDESGEETRKSKRRRRSDGE